MLKTIARKFDPGQDAIDLLEEESAMFPKIVESDVDLKARGRKLANEKHKLQAASKPPKANGQAAASRGARA